MSETPRDDVYLAHIAERIERIEDYTAAGREASLASTLLQDGTIRGFEVIGEAVKRLSDDVKRQAPNVPWRQISGFRDVLIHDYIGVDADLVWETVEHHLPDLKEAVAALRTGGTRP